MHGETGLTYDVAARKRERFSLIERNSTLAVVNRFDGVVDSLDIVGFVGYQSTLIDRNDAVDFAQHIESDGRIVNISRGGNTNPR